MDREIDMPCGSWQTQWIERTYNPLRSYILLASYALSLTIICLGVVGFFTIRRSTKELINDPAHRTSIFTAMNKKVLRITKGHFFVAHVYLLNVIVITLVDAIVCFLVLKDDAVSDPSVWNTTAVLEVAIYSFYLLALFTAAFTLFPLAQMLVVTRFLARFKRHHDLDSFVPEARFFSTHVAQIWCMLTFFVVAWWAPAQSNSVRRYVAVQACFGSALAWLEASYAFNFHSDKLEQDDLEAVSGGVREVLAMFRKTVRAVHASEKHGLPRYHPSPDAPSEKQALLERAELSSEPVPPQ
ncbi:uncharacterized protein LTR77_001465 [Saxophila tyrrhenica]|uniref:Transmembrane protein n=1 Tax=Saxophila tyrrhenica TaxID=1690608 RepID=A0AAV9PKC4_9PEZI|nr:hypothetical protein LTR77_001465 [Saxophila tyrrhenica]